MTEPDPIVVTGLPRTFMTEDADLVHIHFAREGGEPLVLQLSASVLSRVMTRLTELVTGLHTQRGATTGHLEIHAVNVAALTAEAPIGGGKVILGIRAENGLVHHFALLPDQAMSIREGLTSAEKSARDQASKPRQ